MRLEDVLSLSIALTLIQSTTANPMPEPTQALEDLQTVEKRGCSNPCGYNNWLCCSADQYCYTNALTQATCMNGGGATAAVTTVVQSTGTWVYSTMTYVETDLQTITTTLSSFVPCATTSQCPSGQTLCGTSCCLTGQYCAASNQCVNIGVGSASSLYTVTTIITNTASAPLLPTTNTIVTVTATGTAATTVPYITPVGTGGAIITPTASSSGHLSAGAIAGIVIGVILGILLLFLLCLCFCAKELIDGVLDLFGLGKRNRRREVEEVDVYERRTGRANRTWFGTRPARGSRTEVIEEKRKSGGGIAPWLWGAGGLAALWAVLGVKRRRDNRNDKVSVDSYSYYSYTDTSASSASTHGPRRSRAGSRANRSRSRSRR